MPRVEVEGLSGESYSVTVCAGDMVEHSLIVLLPFLYIP